MELILLERFIKLDFAFYKAADASVMNTQGQGGVFGRVARLRPPSCWIGRSLPYDTDCNASTCLLCHGLGASVTMPAEDPHRDDTTASEQPDWYFENGLLVYTAAYHLKRGACCGSGCRHCPYEPRHIEGTTDVRA